MAVVSAMQHGLGLLLLDTGKTQRKGEFVTAAHGQDRVKQTSGWKNVHSKDTKLRPQRLVDGLSDDLRMTDGVRTVLVYPRVKGGDIHVAYFLTIPSHGMQSHHACSSTKKRPRGVPEVVRDRTSEYTETRQPRCLPDGPTGTPTFLCRCNRLGAGPCVCSEWLDTAPSRFDQAWHNFWRLSRENRWDIHGKYTRGTRRWY